MEFPFDIDFCKNNNRICNRTIINIHSNLLDLECNKCYTETFNEYGYSYGCLHCN
jgi:hypothetical protein